MTTIPALIDETLKRCFPWWRETTSRYVSSRARRRFEYGLIVVGVFIAGFLAWRDEHAARLKAEQDLATLSANQMKNVTIGPRPTIGPIGGSSCSDTCEYNIPIVNNGQISIDILKLVYLSFLTKEAQTTQQLKEGFVSLRATSSAYEDGTPEELHLDPGTESVIKVRAVLTDATLSELQGGNAQVYFIASILSKNDDTPKGYAVLTDVCFSFKQSYSERYPCLGINRVETVKLGSASK